MDEIADKLVAAGFRVFSSGEIRSKTYLHFSFNNKVGYIQNAFGGGFDYSTRHRPCLSIGTGFALYNCEPFSIELAKDACNTIAPSWWRQGPEGIQKTTVESFLKEFHRDKREIYEYISFLKKSE